MAAPVDRVRNEILHRYAAGERSFVELDLDEGVLTFDGADLSGINFSRCFIVASFRGARLCGANFSSANVKTCDFSYADLSGAVFDGAAIDAAEFDGANLSGASFLGASEHGHVYGPSETPLR
jgi:uncharacterized protein YjbI with pentapeptide repeats